MRLRDIAIALCIVGCSSSADSTADTAAAVAVRLRFDSLTSAIRRVDIDRMLSVRGRFGADTCSRRRLLEGRAIVERDFRDGFGAIRRVDSLVIGNGALRVLSPTAVVLTVPIREMFTDTVFEPVLMEHGQLSGVAVQRGGASCRMRPSMFLNRIARPSWRHCA